MSLSKLLANGYYYLPENGHFISEKQRRINEILKDYDRNLELQWIPPSDRSASDVAFRVVHRPPGRPAYVVLTASEADERLLARVFEYDQQKAAQRLGGNGNLLSFIDNYNAAVQLSKAKELEDKQQEAHEIAAAAIRNNKSHFYHKVNGRVIDFESPRNR
jgi:hypothetical protein